MRRFAVKKTFVAYVPVTPPKPIWSVPPLLWLIAPLPPLESVSPMDTKPPLLMVSVPLLLSPTERFPLLAHVPLVIVTLLPPAPAA